MKYRQKCYLDYFLEYVLFFLDDNVDEECSNSKKFSLRVLLSICLIFCQFQPGVAYKKVAYKKRACIYLKVFEGNDSSVPST